MNRYTLFVIYIVCLLLVSPHKAMASHPTTLLDCGEKTDAKKIAKKLKKDQLITDEKKAAKSIVKRCKKK